MSEKRKIPMPDEKGYTEKWISVLEKIFSISLTFLGAQIAFWAVMVLGKDPLSNLAIALVIIGITGNLFLTLGALFLLAKKIKTFGRLEK